MGLDIGRGGGVADVAIDYARCTTCGLCARVCKGGGLYLVGDKVVVDQERYFGCFGCGHCVAICPQACITVNGRDLGPEDVLDLPPRETWASYHQLRGLMAARRSVRDFTDRPVTPEVVASILDAASSAPMGLPPSEVGVVVLNGRERVRAFRNDLLDTIRSTRWIFHPAMLALMRPFMSKESHAMLKSFVGPAIDAYVELDEQGEDWFFYDAPLAMCFYATPFADPADPIIAATYAMLAAQAQGLGSCFLGFPAYYIKQSAKLKAKYGFPKRMQPGTVLIMGYPVLTFRRALRRRFADVHDA